MAVLASASVACAGPAMPAPPAPTQGPDHATIAATWIADDGSVVVLNVVIPLGTDPRELPALARDLRRLHPKSRVVVHIFAARAGPERFVIGAAPAGDEPLPPGPRPPTLLATFDYPRSAGR
jgi:hypothetical protein